MSRNLKRHLDLGLTVVCDSTWLNQQGYLNLSRRLPNITLDSPEDKDQVNRTRDVTETLLYIRNSGN